MFETLYEVRCYAKTQNALDNVIHFYYVVAENDKIAKEFAKKEFYNNFPKLSSQEHTLEMTTREINNEIITAKRFLK